VIRWNDISGSSEQMRDVAAWARQVLTVAREYAALR
jgi:hypothetical protein